MDKKVILAVAGSGKTTYIISHLSLEKRCLVVTYTNNNYKNLKQSIIKRFGFFPANIKLFTYFSFLYNFCYKPFVHKVIKAKGLNFTNDFYRYAKKNNLDYYQDMSGRIYSARLSKLLTELKLSNDINKRISKYFDNFYIDEVQDFGGNDFNFLKQISKADVDHLLVGDYFQHTYDTSRDGAVNKNLHSDLKTYTEEFKKLGFNIDSSSLKKSWRCSPTICEFVSERLNIHIESNRKHETEITHISNLEDARKIIEDNTVVKLFYQKHYDYDCFSKNWGESKGEDKHHDICVVLNKNTYKFFVNNNLSELPATTKNKLYVAITRTKNNLFLVSEDLLSSYKKSLNTIEKS
ncbi:DEAD/DEAH box helicase family protein [Chryseobacterium terrae]|uniref:AAA family ATPase n=1 Tax=Chryseobacterium terrae TaxID=3163299 RepID=A0ABW8Y879_9FLAO